MHPALCFFRHMPTCADASALPSFVSTRKPPQLELLPAADILHSRTVFDRRPEYSRVTPQAAVEGVRVRARAYPARMLSGISTAVEMVSGAICRAPGRRSPVSRIFDRRELLPRCLPLSASQPLSRRARGLLFLLQPSPQPPSFQQGCYLERLTRMKLSRPTAIRLSALTSAWMTCCSA